MGGKLVRTIGLARARVKIAMMNIVYNLRRWCWLQAGHIAKRFAIAQNNQANGHGYL